MNSTGSITNGLKTFLLGTACFGLAMSIVAITGCGPTDPDESSLDRIPNVPPSTRSQGEDFLPLTPKK